MRNEEENRICIVSIVAKSYRMGNYVIALKAVQSAWRRRLLINP